jgi:hypothetical protein
MDDITRSGVDDRKVLVLAVYGRTGGTTVLETGNSTPEIPAAWPLAEISADCPHVAQCGGPNHVACLRQRTEAISDYRGARDVGDPRGGANAHRAIGLLRHARATRDRAEIDQHVGLADLFRDSDEEIGSAAK